MDKPLLSICIPTFNRAEIVYECVKNCLKNEFKELEVVVNDNCSTDNTKELLAKIEDSRFSYYRNESNIGYQNLTVVLSKCKGKFALLMSDEDEVYNVDWLYVFNKLRDSGDAAVFQCEYYDEDGNCLVKGPDIKFEKDNSRSYCFALRRCLYAGALIVKKEVLDKVWDSIDKSGYMWSTYPQCVLPLYCIKYGSFQKLEGLFVRRTERNNKVIVPISTNDREPYFSINSRLKQNEEWIKLFFSMGLDEIKLSRIAQEILLMNAREIVEYYNIIYTSDWKKNKSLLMYRKRICNDRDNINKIKWIKIFIGTKRYLLRKEKEYFKNNNMHYYRNNKNNYKKRMCLEWITLLKKLIGVKVRTKN